MKLSLRWLAALALAVLLFAVFPGSAARADSDVIWMTIKTGQARLRSAPSGEVIRTLKKNTSVEFLGTYLSGIWYRVRVDGDEGFIFWDEAKFVQNPTSPEIQKLLFTDEQMKSMAMKVSGNCVNMRAGIAGTKEHKKIVNYYDGLMNKETVYCIAQKKNWYLVVRAKRTGDDGHLVGWVYGDFLDNDSVKKWDKYVGGIPADENTKKQLQSVANALKVMRTLENK